MQLTFKIGEIAVIHGIPSDSLGYIYNGLECTILSEENTLEDVIGYMIDSPEFIANNPQFEYGWLPTRRLRKRKEPENEVAFILIKRTTI